MIAAKRCSRRILVRADGAIVLSRIDDAPVHEVVDDEVLLLARQKPLARILVEDQHAIRITGHVLEERNLEVQTRRVVGLNDAPDPELHGVLARIDREHGHPDHDHRQDADDQQQVHAWVHAWSRLIASCPARASGGAAARRRRCSERSWASARRPAALGRRCMS